jgi:hypothetical protein
MAGPPFDELDSINAGGCYYLRTNGLEETRIFRNYDRLHKQFDLDRYRDYDFVITVVGTRRSCADFQREVESVATATLVVVDRAD